MTVSHFNAAEYSNFAWHILVPCNFDCILPNEIYDIMKKYVFVLKTEFNLSDEKLYIFPSENGGKLINFSDAVRRSTKYILGQTLTTRDCRHQSKTVPIREAIEDGLFNSEMTAKRDYYHKEPQALATFPRKFNSFNLIITNYNLTDLHQSIVGQMPCSSSQNIQCSLSSKNIPFEQCVS